ncbi:MAG: 16S rRNA (uracil(1498)-N(3))-methyltransferase [Desulfobacterales bacterium]|nr:16S rRNA (uracil(1498)-N(3))-methyltransferase [Desulfobacterales bacterium]
MRYFFIEPTQVTIKKPVITGADAKHIKNVLRLKAGDTIGLFDGTGIKYEAKILDITAAGVEIEIIRDFPLSAESTVQIVIAQAFLKEKKMDILVRQLTELGVSKWIPFIAERSVARPDTKRLSIRMARWEKIAREAVKQCKRSKIPEIVTAFNFEEVIDFAKQCDLKIIFWENESKPINPLLLENKKGFKNVIAVLGPEGGFTIKEIEQAEKNGFMTASLGPRILKAETATLAACTLMQYLFGDMS